MSKRIYRDSLTIPFAVRVRQKHGDKVKSLANQLGISEVQVKRMIVEAGVKALEAVA